MRRRIVDIVLCLFVCLLRKINDNNCFYTISRVLSISHRQTLRVFYHGMFYKYLFRYQYQSTDRVSNIWIISNKTDIWSNNRKDMSNSCSHLYYTSVLKFYSEQYYISYIYRGSDNAAVQCKMQLTVQYFSFFFHSEENLRGKYNKKNAM